MSRRAVYAAAWCPSDDLREGSILDTFQTAREAIASAETSVEQSGGGAFAFSQTEGQPFVLLRKFGTLWPETRGFNPGDVIGPGYLRLTETREIVRLRLFDVPTRRERREGAKERDNAEAKRRDNSKLDI